MLLAAASTLDVETRLFARSMSVDDSDAHTVAMPPPVLWATSAESTLDGKRAAHATLRQRRLASEGRALQ